MAISTDANPVTHSCRDLSQARDEIAARRDRPNQHLEELSHLDRLKSQFLSIASHELKTPLTAISGYLQVTLREARRRLSAGQPSLEDWQSEQQTLVDHLQKVTAQTARLARLVDELLDVSRIETGRLALRQAQLDLGDLSKDVVTRMQLHTADHSITYSGDDGAIVHGDRDHLEQVLNNLIGNAIKYSPAARPIEVSVRRVGDEVEVSVADQGVGIPPQELQSIFGLFYRSPEAASGQVAGMGLGLYICKEIVDRHGGRIWAESTPSKGSTFYFTIPRAPAEEVVPSGNQPQSVGAAR